jgi:hypothetical protein
VPNGPLLASEAKKWPATVSLHYTTAAVEAETTGQRL